VDRRSEISFILSKGIYKTSVNVTYVVVPSISLIGNITFLRVCPFRIRLSPTIMPESTVTYLLFTKSFISFI
jgi:hypothetical protein